MTDVNYKDRKIDVMITQNYEGKLSFRIPNKIVAGIQKAVQMFILELFTALDSNIFRVKGGTVFALYLKDKKGTPYTSLISHYISAAISTVMENLSKEKSTYSDENIISAAIEELVENKTELDVKIAVTTGAGNDYKFIVPIKLLATGFN